MFGLDIIGGLIQQKPSVPKLTPIDLQQEQAKAVSANQANLPAIENLTSAANRFTSNQIQDLLRLAIPNYDQLVSGVSSSIGSFLKGEIPQDVSEQIQRSDAAKALGGGFGGSGMHGNLVARDLGLTSLNLVDKGISSAESWLTMMDRMITPGMMDVTSMFVTPQMQTQLDVGERNVKMGYDFYKSQLDAAYNPWNIVGNSLINTDAQLAQIASSIAGSAAGKLI